MDNHLIEFDNIQLYLKDEVYQPREDSFELLDCLQRENLRNNSILVEIGSGTGLLIIWMMRQYTKTLAIAVDLNYSAAKLTLYNIKKNNLENISVICGDLLTSVRPGFDKTIIFNPPYLPKDENIDHNLKFIEKIQFTGGVLGYEIVNKLISSINDGVCIFTIISSAATNPTEFSNMHKNFNCRILSSKKIGFEIIWVIKVENKNK